MAKEEYTCRITEIEAPDVLLWFIWAIQQYAIKTSIKQANEKYGDIISVYRSEPFFIELMPKGIDKASSIDRMLSTVGMTRENTICCGDGFNDMTMIEYAGVGVAMANAQEKVKEKADYITDSNDEDGIVKVIDKFIL